MIISPSNFHYIVTFGPAPTLSYVLCMGPGGRSALPCVLLLCVLSKYYSVLSKYLLRSLEKNIAFSRILLRSNEIVILFHSLEISSSLPRNKYFVPPKKVLHSPEILLRSLAIILRSLEI